MCRTSVWYNWIVTVVAIDVVDDSHCVDAVAILIVPCCCRVFDVNDNDNDFVDFQACKNHTQKNKRISKRKLVSQFQKWLSN